MKTHWKDFLKDAGAEFADGLVLHFGNPHREQEVALSGTVFADLSHLGLIAAQGADAESFLQGQFSNDVTRTAAATSQLNAYCTPKGRILGLFRLFRIADTFYLRLPADTLEPVLQRLRMYVLRAAVTLEDASDNLLGIGVAGEGAAGELAAAGVPVPEQVNQVAAAEALTVLRVPGIHPRFEIYATSLAAATRLWDAFNVHAAPVGESAWRLLEIQAGLPTIHAGTAELFVPQMLNLQLLDGLDFRKGCYPGQEIVARTRYLGSLKRRMYAGHTSADAPPQPGDPLYLESDPEQAVGRIVDAQPYPDGGCSALAVIRIDAAESDQLHCGASDGPEFAIRALPYPFEG
jgi:folate-binding protein YgfZ